MSGPKDYGISYTIERLAEFRRRNEAVQQARAAAVRATLDAARRGAASRRHADAAQRQTTLDADLQRRADASREAVDRSNAAARRSAAPPLPVPSSVTTPTDVAPAAPTDANSADDAERQAVLQGWAAVLNADPAVSAFAAADRAAWAAKAAAANADPAALAAEAQAVHDRAGETQARFETRNALLRDVIDSMQELGYFVSDPQLSDPADPTGPVVLKATCGSETVTTTVDLSDAIKSVWDGQEHEHCKSSFFDYTDAMKARGVAVEPERADLRERPILRQHDANELPRSGGRAEGP